MVKELAEYYKNIPLLEKRKEEPKQETLEEAKVNNLIKLFGKDFDLEPRNVIESCNDSFIEGSKWQQEQERNNENSWFNEYQKVEDYIIKSIGDKFFEATPDKYKTASEATIALLENNWQQEQNKNLYSEEDVRKTFSRYNEVIAHRDIEKWQPWIDKQFKK